MAAVIFLAGFTLGAVAAYRLAVHRLGRQVEAMHAAMVATRADTGPHRWQVADSYRDGWRHPIRHLLHRRAAA